MLANLCASLLVIAAAGTTEVPVRYLGMASGNGEYQVARGGESIARPDGAFVLRTGDQVTAADAQVRLQFLSGEAAALSEQSSVSLARPEFLQGLTGSLVFAQPQDSTMTVGAAGLDIAPISPANPENAGDTLVYLRVDESLVEVSSLSGTFAVTDDTLGERVGVVGAGDAMVFHKVAGVWTVAPARIGQIGNDPVRDGADPVTEDEDERRAVWILPAGVGAGIVATSYGGYFVKREYVDDDDDDDDPDEQRARRQPVSPSGEEEEFEDFPTR